MTPRSRIDELTSREVEILRLVAAGLTNRQAADSLGVSVMTVDAHLRSIYSKLRVKSQKDAAKLAVEKRLA
jgi:DNA-binding CsgD family transcriptional regulator